MRGRRAGGAPWGGVATGRPARGRRRESQRRRERRSRSWHEPVADPPAGLEVARLGRDLLDLLAKAPDVNRDRARVELRGVPPHARHELVAREHAARVAREEPEEVELLGGQPDRRAGPRRLARLAFETDVAEGELGGGRSGGRAAPEDGADARGELSRRERLRDVVVGAELEPDDPVGLLAPGRQ